MFLAYLYLLIFLFFSTCCIKNSNLFNGFVQSHVEELKKILIPYWKVIMILYVLVITLQLGRRSNPMNRMFLAVKIPRVQHSLQFFEERCVRFDYLKFNYFSMFLNGNDKTLLSWRHKTTMNVYMKLPVLHASYVFLFFSSC